MGPLDTLTLAVYSLTILLGVPANALALFIFYRRARARLTPNLIYMINLCVSDLAFILLLPLKILEVIWPDWSPPSFLCPFNSMVHFGTLYTSACFLTAVSAGRYLSAAFPLHYRRCKKPLYSCLVCVAIWCLVSFHAVSAGRYLSAAFPLHYRRCKKPLYSCLVCVAIWCLVSFHGALLAILENSLGANATLFTGNGSACYQEFSPEQLALLAPVRLELSVALFFLPLVITAFCYAGCIHVLMKSHLHQQKKRRAVRLAVATLSIFVLCFGPYNVSHVVGYARGENLWWRKVAMLPGACNAFLDPLIFYFLSSTKDHSPAWVWRSVGQRCSSFWQKMTLGDREAGKAQPEKGGASWGTTGPGVGSSK
nr:free fatty acid receptor 3-like [Pelodiscus sinensis]|eukprot:XP_006110327.1 free fatty acid receptor 3-like [Pelodiscus sinensis]